MSISPGLRDLLALSLVPGLGPRLTQAMLDHFGSATAARQTTLEQLLAVPRFGAKTARQILDTLQTVDLEAELVLMETHGVHLMGITEGEYPKPLRNLSDAPHLLYARGTRLPSDDNAVAIVGSRECTPYGLKQARELAAGLVRGGFTVVSGLARGIDGAAHEAALDAGGRTIAVQPGGLADVFPASHRDLAVRIAESGMVMSEVPMRVPPDRGMFHARNRLIAGLSLATVVVEANERSGSLITARHSIEQGREVFVLPANVDSIASAGSLQLLRKGAKMIRNIQDLMEDLRGIAPTAFQGAPVRPAPRATPANPTDSSPMSEGHTTPEPAVPVVFTPVNLDPQQAKIWDILQQPQSIDSITDALNLSAGEVVRILFQMELKRLVRRLPGNIYERKS